DMYSTNSFNNNDSGFVNGPGGTKAPGKEYFSPWDIWYNRGPDFVDKQPAYIFWNGNADAGDEDDAYSPYTLEVHAWVGLAYYDGFNDGIYNDPSSGGAGASYNLGNGLYSTLYDTNTPNGFPQEVGALVQMQPFIINPMTGARLESVTDHLPIDPGTVKYGDHFDFPGGLTTQEEELLRDYGKVFFYEVNVFEAGTFIGQYIMHPQILSLPNYGPDTYWESVADQWGNQIQGDMPLLGSFDLYYINHPVVPETDWDPNFGSGSIGNPASPLDNECDSHEVVFYLPPGMNLHSQAITGGSVPKSLYMGFTHHPFTLWQSSSLDLRIF
ncbi:MAG: hypothetical protein KIG55_08860, partial [Myroides sp.]|nr:hypothetical protein [Myroides sp.]